MSGDNEPYAPDAVQRWFITTVELLDPLTEVAALQTIQINEVAERRSVISPGPVE